MHRSFFFKKHKMLLLLFVYFISYNMSSVIDADAARIEAGLQSDETQSNGYSSPSSGTPSISQYHTPAVTPDCVSLDYPVNYERSPHELFNNVSTPHELRPDGDGIPPPPPAPPAPPQYPGAPPAPPPPAPPPLGGPLHRNRKFFFYLSLVKRYDTFFAHTAFKMIVNMLDTSLQ